MVTSEITCPACGHKESVQAEAALTLADVGLFVCNQCRTRAVHGALLPRVVVEPFSDRKGFTWTRTRYQDPITKADLYVVDLDPRGSAMVATATLSLTVGT